MSDLGQIIAACAERAELLSEQDTELLLMVTACTEWLQSDPELSDEDRENLQEFLRLGDMRLRSLADDVRLVADTFESGLLAEPADRAAALEELSNQLETLAVETRLSAASSALQAEIELRASGG